MPATDHRDGQVQQIGQHRWCVEPANALLDLDQAQPLPQLGLGDDFQLAGLDPLAGEPVDQFVGQAVSCEQLVFAHDDQVDLSVDPSATCPPWARTNCWASRRGMPPSLPAKATRRPQIGLCTAGSATVVVCPLRPARPRFGRRPGGLRPALC